MAPEPDEPREPAPSTEAAEAAGPDADTDEARELSGTDLADLWSSKRKPRSDRPRAGTPEPGEPPA